MVKYDEAVLDDVFNALSSRSRRHALTLLTEQPLTMTQLAEPLGVSLPMLSKHLRILQRAKLIEGKKIGRERELSFRPGALQDAQDWIAFHRQFWNHHLDSLEQFINEMKGEATDGASSRTNPRKEPDDH